MQKLKVAANSGQNPGFDFLQECWNDDPAKADCDQEIASEISAVRDCNCGWGVGGLGEVAITLSQNSVQLKRLLLDGAYLLMQKV
ncbi:hypothetical protein [Nostoc sp. 'Peltigera malacea cyanobiont' DB3992]|uniref:hypothetical protein n=1 Tax=Nostoc sp. 'Peltigera malacea cyanobiont' DB3992 TaxID=1206980 RepID=UPI0015D51882|nr:hypothetical protein [Nostoc sp. 'Peltigera malacea cyanobiont' DB3992]